MCDLSKIYLSVFLRRFEQVCEAIEAEKYHQIKNQIKKIRTGMLSELNCFDVRIRIYFSSKDYLKKMM